MDIGLPLDRMTTEEKLLVLEQIWDDLCGRPSEVPSPPWHEEVLKGREKRVQEGASRFVDWAEAKRNIRESTE